MSEGGGLKEAVLVGLLTGALGFGLTVYRHVTRRPRERPKAGLTCWPAINQDRAIVQHFLALQPYASMNPTALHRMAFFSDRFLSRKHTMEENHQSQMQLTLANLQGLARDFASFHRAQTLFLYATREVSQKAGKKGPHRVQVEIENICTRWTQNLEEQLRGMRSLCASLRAS